MSTTSSDSSTSTATSSSDEAAPGPSKRPRVTKKVKKAAKKAKPSKVLAKNAKKKNDKKCRRSILKHVKEAQKITSEKVGQKMEKECQRVEKNLDSWKKDGVEVDALQRYVGRIMKKVKELNVIVSCDHAVPEPIAVGLFPTDCEIHIRRCYVYHMFASRVHRMFHVNFMCISRVSCIF